MPSERLPKNKISIKSPNQMLKGIYSLNIFAKLMVSSGRIAEKSVCIPPKIAITKYDIIITKKYISISLPMLFRPERPI